MKYTPPQHDPHSAAGLFHREHVERAPRGVARFEPRGASPAAKDAPAARAFTLIELLVVVAIITLLISILMPSLRNARKAAKSVVCMSQLRSLDFAWIQYVSDSRNALYYYPGNNNAAFDKFWMAIVERYTSNVDKLRVCPEATQLSEVVWGTASVSWSGKNHPAGYWIHNSAGDYHYGSYAINGWLYNNYVAGESYLSWLEPGVQTSNAPAFLDSAWVDIWPRDTDVPAANIEDPYNGGNWGAGMVRATINRHNLAINISFIDGSTRLVPLGDLWTLAWSRKFRPGFYQPPPFQ